MTKAPYNEEESTLLASQGNQTAIDVLVLTFNNMVFKIAKKHSRGADHYDDLIGTGNLALCESAITYGEKERSCSFSTFAYKRIEASIIHSLRTTKGQLSSTEWEGRRHAVLQRQYKELSQELGRDPTMQEYEFVYGEQYQENIKEVEVEEIDREMFVRPENGSNLDYARMPEFAKVVVQEICDGTGSDIVAEVSSNLSIGTAEVKEVIQIASKYIHF
tara:strand:+ start:742 stop:1395 length:654 start_codon:yes stop_codon:yes gene_type:complete